MELKYENITKDNLRKVARSLADHSAELCNVNKEDNWIIYNEQYLEDAKVAIRALFS